MTHATRLDATIRAVCPPIHGVSISTATTPPTVEIDYRPEATTAQRQAAADALAAFDWSDTAQQAWERQQAVTNAVNVTFTGMEASQISDRVTLRYVFTCINDVREHVGLPRILEPDHITGLLAAVAAGAGDPVTP